MPFPNKSLIVPRSPRLCLMGQACRVQRRKLALRHKTSTQGVKLIPNFQTNQGPAGQRYDESSSTRAEKVVEQGDWRETFFHSILEEYGAYGAIVEESRNRI